jgi:hypothetical protein
MYAPFILLFHWVNLLYYFWRMDNDPNNVYWNNYGWTVYYYSTNNVTLIAYLVAFIIRGFPSRSDANFIMVDIFFTFTLIIATIMQYLNWIEYTYGYQQAITCMVIATMLIAVNGYRHGFFKYRYEND